jgi:hypothetical protein
VLDDDGVEEGGDGIEDTHVEAVADQEEVITRVAHLEPFSQPIIFFETYEWTQQARVLHYTWGLCYKTNYRGNLP